MQERASAVPPNLTRDLEAKIESQKYDIQSLQKYQKTTQDSLNRSDEVNLNSIQGVCVEECVAASTSSESRITGPAISHLPQAGGHSELFPPKREYNAESSFKIGCSSEYSSSGSTQFHYAEDVFTN